VFFFIDPDFLNDKTLLNVHEVTLSYTFFKTGGEEDLELPPELKGFKAPTNLHQPVKGRSTTVVTKQVEEKGEREEEVKK